LSSIFSAMIGDPSSPVSSSPGPANPSMKMSLLFHVAWVGSQPARYLRKIACLAIVWFGVPARLLWWDASIVGLDTPRRPVPPAQLLGSSDGQPVMGAIPCGDRTRCPVRELPAPGSGSSLRQAGSHLDARANELLTAVASPPSLERHEPALSSSTSPWSRHRTVSIDVGHHGLGGSSNPTPGTVVQTRPVATDRDCPQFG